MKIKRGKISKEEIIADAIFVLISAFISLTVIFLFDIHHSFYEWPFQLSFIFNSIYPYIIFTLAGTILGFFMIKLFLLGEKEEQTAKRKKRK
jgi:H+/Cl- antiporter ClcA